MAIIRGTYVTRLSGKVGDVVYRMRDGQNIASQKASVVKNPRTDAQQTQRMIMATVSAAYSAMKEICDHSFEGITYGSKSMGEFMRRNIAIMKSQQQEFNAKGNPYMLPNPLIVSNGSIPTIAIDSVTANNVRIELTTNYNVPQAINTLTVKQFHDLMGIEIGDQITIVGLGANENVLAYESETITQYKTNFAYARLVFKTTSGATTLMSSGSINTDALDTNNSQNYNAVSFTAASANDPLVVNLNIADMSDSANTGCAGTIIISRKTGTNWLRSTQILKVETAYNNTRAEILPTYSPTGNKYLNNAIV